MPLSALYILIALSAVFLMWLLPSSWWWLWLPLCWIALAFTLVASAYAVNRPGIFRKRSNGQLSMLMRWVLLPFLWFVGSFNALFRRYDTVPRFSKIRDDLYLGSRLFSVDIDELQRLQIGAILDVTSEFDAIAVADLQQAGINYLNLPVLDHSIPSKVAMRRALQWMSRQQRHGRKLLVHCALGRGRSVLMVAAWLLCRESFDSVTQVLTDIRQHRTSIRLNRRQLKFLKRLWQSQELSLKHRLWLIVNPVSGGGKWPKYREEICQRLQQYYEVQVLETTPQRPAAALARKAIRSGADILVAGGGDGTVNEVASAVIGTDLPLGIIPLGTTNALSQVLWGLGAKLEPLGTALEAIINGEQQRIDTARCNGRPVLLLVGVGFEAQMIKTANRERKNALGELAYLQGFWQAFSQNREMSLNVRLDKSAPFTLHTGSVTVANSAPVTTILAQGAGHTDLCDGLLDVTWLTPTEGLGESLLTIAELTVNGLTKQSLEINAHHQKVAKIKISSAKRMDYVIDGEYFRGRTLNIQVRPASLNVLLPSATED
ncbi:diacylglycerol kinase family protein [Shewanella sp.]|uniref:diacylglycerol kinase family protein n=1 Tax=Shewanella sp. TaxID=50422 RepID=UPI003D098435